MAHSALAACLAAMLLTFAAASAVEHLQPEAFTQYCTVSASNLQGCAASLPGLELQVKCCMPFKLMQELDCFCLPGIRQSARSAISPNVWEALTECDLGGDLNLDRGCLPTVQAAESNGPNKVDLEAYVEEPVFENALTGPVLDLGAMLDAQDDMGDMTVTYGGNGDMTITFDMELESGKDVLLDLDLSNETKAGITLELDIEVDGDTEVSIEVDDNMIVTLSGAQLEQGEEIAVDISSDSMTGSALLDGLSTWAGMLPAFSGNVLYAIMDSDSPDGSVEVDMEFGEPRDADQQPLFTIDVDVDLPAELKGALGDSDVTIEMDLDMDPARLSLTRSDGDAALHFLTSQDLGALLSQAAEWVASILPGPQLQQSTEGHFDPTTQQVLEGITELLSQIGEEVGERLPHGQIQPGQSYDFDFEPSQALRSYFESSDTSLAQLDSLALAQGRDPKASRKSMGSLAAAVSSSLLISRPNGGQQECRLCRWVHVHLGLLWGIVYANLALLMCCFLMAAASYVRQQTQPASELEEPLIVNAADFANAMEHKSLLAPVWEPAHKLQL